MVLLEFALGYPVGVFLHRNKFSLVLVYTGILLTFWTILVVRDYNATVELYRTASLAEFIVNYVLILNGMFWGESVLGYTIN